MRTFVHKQKPAQEAKSASSARPGRAFSGQSREVSSIVCLQRTIGNQAVQRLLQANAEELEAGSSTAASTSFTHDFSRIRLHAKANAEIQPSLTISNPGDIYEQEADRVADEVMRISEPQLQRSCPCGGGCPKCQTREMDQETEHLHRNSVRSSGTGEAAVPPIVDDVLSAPGRSLDPTVRRFMESRIGHDFSQVRVHADARAADSAAAVNALAYTVGQDIVFGPGRYAPQTSEGRRLLAHELTHVVQQRASRQTTSAMPGQAATQSRRALRRTPAPAGPTQTPFVGPTQDDGTPPAWATEDLKRKLTAVVLAEADPGQEDDVMWIYINLVTEFEGEAGLEKSSAFKRKGREYRIYLYVLGDDTYGADRLQAGQTIADYCTNNGWFKRERVPRVQPLRTKVEQMLTAPESSPYKGWTGQGSLMDFNRNSEGDDYWKWARAYFGLQQQGSVNEIYVKMLPPKTPAGLTTVIFNGDAIKAYFAAHPDKLPAQVPLYAH